MILGILMQRYRLSLVNFTLLSQRSFVPSLASVTKSAVVGHFLSLREPTISGKPA